MSQLQKSMLTCETGSVAPASSVKKGVVQSQSMLVARALSDALKKTSLRNKAVIAKDILQVCVDYGNSRSVQNAHDTSSNIGSPLLIDFWNLGLQLYETSIVRPKLASRGEVVHAPIKPDQMYAGLVHWSLQTSDQLLFLCPEFTCLLQATIGRINNVGQDRNNRGSGKCSVNCLDASATISSTAQSLQRNPQFKSDIYSGSLQSRKAGSDQAKDALKTHIARLLSAGVFEAYYRLIKCSEKNQSFRKRFRDEHYKLTDQDWNSVRVEPLRSSLDSLVSLLITSMVKP